MDTSSFQSANLLLHNEPNATCLEIASGGTTLEVSSPGWLAYCGGPLCPELGHGSARYFPANTLLTFQPSERGLWGYLATPSGWAANTQFGSTSRHERSNLGTPISPGDFLNPARNIPNPFPGIALRRLLSEQLPQLTNTHPIRLHPGPHPFSKKDLQTLTSSLWKLTTALDRTGYRLHGPTLSSPGSQPSSPVLPGSLQVTTGGHIIVTLNDGPTVGGYPVIALIDPRDLSPFVQHSPDSTINFTWNTPNFI